MISPIFFLLFATAFSAGASVLNIKRDSDEFTIISNGLSAVNTSVTNAFGPVAQLSAQDPNSVTNFRNTIFDILFAMSTAAGSIQGAVVNQPFLDDTQAQQLGGQVGGLSNHFIQLVQTILGKQTDIDNSNQTCFVQVNAGNIDAGLIIMISPVITASPNPADTDTVDGLGRILANLTTLINLSGQSSCDVLGGI